jgi:membrane-anchored protein YejM (alkaline phosphatase superfamily)
MLIINQENIYSKLATAKPILALVVVMFAGIHAHKYLYIPFSMIEIFLIFLFTNFLTKKHRAVAYAINSVLCLIVLAEQAVLLFSGEYITFIMLENLGSVKALGNSLFIYILFFLLVLILSLLPVKYVRHSLLKNMRTSLFALGTYISVLLILLYFIGTPVSSVEALIVMANHTIKTKIEARVYANANVTQIGKTYYRTSIEQGIEKSAQLPEYPNVIVLFTEGMSSEVIDRYSTNFVDNQDDVLTPNLNRFFEKSLVFDNYYNHTAATYRGLWGQLYSGYQYLGGGNTLVEGFTVDGKEVEENMKTNIISAVDILNDNGYDTRFINPEPNNSQFLAYLRSFNYDAVTSGDITDRFLTDKEAFELLMNTAEQCTAPFFIGFYNVGTHHGFTSPDAQYGNGKSDIQNKFYNYDVQFGSFLETFMESNLADNTILIVTADHASYPSPEYKAIFGSNRESFIDEVPLIIYYRGVNHRILDAGGRNSLDLAPTILDLLDIADHDNYFLGKSLFLAGAEATPFERISNVDNVYYYTGEGTVTVADESHTATIQGIKDYYAISMQ